MKDSFTLSFKYVCKKLVQISVFLFLMSLLLRTLDSKNTELLAEKMSQFEQARNEIEILSVGTSHNQAFHFPSMEKKGFTFYDFSSDIEQAVLKARLLAPTMAKLRYVVMPISPVFFSYTNRAITDDYKQEQQFLRNFPKELKWSEYPPKSLFAFYVNKFLPVPNVKSEIANWLKSRILNQNSLVNNGESSVKHCVIDGFLGGYDDFLLQRKEFIRFAKRSQDYLVRKVDVSLQFSSQLRESNKQLILELSTQLKVLDISLILVVVPFTQEFFEQEFLLSEWLSFTKPTLDLLSREEGIFVYDYHDFFYEQLSSSKKNNYFRDDSHLAVQGAKIFSRKLGLQLNELEKERDLR